MFDWLRLVIHDPYAMYWDVMNFQMYHDNNAATYVSVSIF